MHGYQYIDEHVLLRDHDGSGQDHYYMLQELYSVAGLANASGHVEEMYVYDTYGNATIHAFPLGDVNRDDQIVAGSHPRF